MCFLHDMDYIYPELEQFMTAVYTMQAGHGQLDGSCSELQFVCCAPQVDVVYIHIQVHILALS